MIKATVQECRDANRALRRINEEVRLKAKAAWRVSRVLTKLKSVIADFESAQLKLFMDAGGTQTSGGVVLHAPVRGAQTDDEWVKVLEENRLKVNALHDGVKALLDEPVEIDYDPIEIGLFDENALVSANDLVDAGPFLKE